MEIIGRLIALLPIETGEGKNGQWKKRDFVIETDGKYPKKVCITAMKDPLEHLGNFPEGSNIKVSFDISSREYNGKYYTNVNAWKIERA